VSKVDGLAVSPARLAEIIRNNPLAAGWLLAAAKMDDDFKRKLLPADFDDWDELSKCFGAVSSSKLDCAKVSNYEQVDLPPFVKHVLIRIVADSTS
jgi:hypothetical protein